MAATPTLLMLAAFGLERIETGLGRGAAGLLERVEAELGHPALFANPQFRPPEPADHV